MTSLLLTNFSVSGNTSLNNVSVNNLNLLSLNSSGTLTIGDNATTSGITIGRTGITTTISGLQANQMISNVINPNGVGAGCTLWATLTTGTAQILNNAARTATTSMLTGSGINTFNLGGINTTHNFSGTVMNFQATNNNFTNNLSVQGNTSLNNTSVNNLSVSSLITTPSIDSIGELNIGKTNSTAINIGKTGNVINV
jgi:hypothetical protein